MEEDGEAVLCRTRDSGVEDIGNMDTFSISSSSHERDEGHDGRWKSWRNAPGGKTRRGSVAQGAQLAEQLARHSSPLFPNDLYRKPNSTTIFYTSASTLFHHSNRAVTRRLGRVWAHQANLVQLVPWSFDRNPNPRLSHLSSALHACRFVSNNG